MTLLARLALVLSLCAAAARADEAPAVADPYAGLEAIAGDSHQHAATYYLLERFRKEKAVPGFGAKLHEWGPAAPSYDAMKKGGYDWGSLSFHDTNFPGALANICIDPKSEKYGWWRANAGKTGFPDAAAADGATVSPPYNEALALSRLASAKTEEGEGGFLAFTGREFTDRDFFPVGVSARKGGHKILILPGETEGLCSADGNLRGDEYCADEYHLYRWLAGASTPQGVLIQAHPGQAPRMDLRPVHPMHAPGGFSDAFVQGIEVSSAMQDPQFEEAYQRALALGLRVFPAFGSDSHDATHRGNEATASEGATVCWVAARTRRALVEAMHARRCYYATAWKPELRFALRAGAGTPWVAMGGLVDAPQGDVDVRIEARNDPRNLHADAKLGKRFDVVELVDAHGKLLASEPCTRAGDGRDRCTLTRSGVAIGRGAVYARIRMRETKPEGCRSHKTPVLLPNCGKVVIGGAIYVNWPAYQERAPYRACRFGRDDVPCATPGCLPAEADRDQDGFPDGCDVCPELANPDQRDGDLDGFGDACPRSKAAGRI